MKKKIIILLSVVIILLMGIVVWFNIPLDLMDLDPNDAPQNTHTRPTAAEKPAGSPSSGPTKIGRAHV